VLVHNEFYLGAVANGVTSLDYSKMLDTLPDLFAFNGRPALGGTIILLARPASRHFLSPGIRSLPGGDG